MDDDSTADFIFWSNQKIPAIPTLLLGSTSAVVLSLFTIRNSRLLKQPIF